MLEIYECDASPGTSEADELLLLDHEVRGKGRFKAYAESGTEIRVFLERGKPLQAGDILLSKCGKRIKIGCADEAVVTAHAENWNDFSKACYHLGNRHIKLQIDERWLRFKPDHVLEELTQKLGLRTQHEETAFIPESGAYSHGHSRERYNSHEH